MGDKEPGSLNNFSYRRGCDDMPLEYMYWGIGTQFHGGATLSFDNTPCDFWERATIFPTLGPVIQNRKRLETQREMRKFLRVVVPLSVHKSSWWFHLPNQQPFGCVCASDSDFWSWSAAGLRLLSVCSYLSFFLYMLHTLYILHACINVCGWLGNPVSSTQPFPSQKRLWW